LRSPNRQLVGVQQQVVDLEAEQPKAEQEQLLPQVAFFLLLEKPHQPLVMGHRLGAGVAQHRPNLLFELVQVDRLPLQHTHSQNEHIL
jgi:hypothetical protein